LVLAAFLVPAATAVDAPEQPIPYSHKLHAGDLKLPCKTCHANPDPGETEGIPQAATCMQCHSTVKTDSPAIQKLAAYAQNSRKIPWVRVYEIPGWVNFSHRRHVTAGNTCEDCHGKVAETDRISRVTDLSMGGCMNCHQAKSASTECTYCHDQR
jgi:c(7)-type cytochrome triheme protein